MLTGPAGVEALFPAMALAAEVMRRRPEGEDDHLRGMAAVGPTDELVQVEHVRRR
jgi:hypothetical protein